MIEIKGLVKNFGSNPVLRGLSMQVSEGEIVTLVGPNGAGKSTLMRIVATLLQPTSGQVVLGGWALPQHASRVRRHIGLVSHHSLLYGDLTALENLLFYGRLYNLDNIEARAQEALKTVGLAARQRDPVSTFSRGMTQRLTIARATLHEPDILLLDEPYTGLDQEASQLLDNLLLAEHEKGRTILMITHDLVHGLNICDRALVLARGKIVTEIDSREIAPGDFLELYAQQTGRANGRSPRRTIQKQP